MIRFLLFILFILSCIATSFAQQTGSFKGIVLDGQTLEAIPFATVALFDNDLLVDGVSTNEMGRFEIATTTAFTHFEISFIGYKTATIALSVVDISDIIEVKLQSSNLELDEVVVEATQTTTTLKIDRKVINLGADLQQSGTTVLEAFDQISEIQTDLGVGTISLRGSGNVRILVNGKPSALNATELLDQIPAASVEKVEIITSPSAKNQADGLSGIINVILKKNRTRGLNLGLNASVGTKRHGYGLTTNYNLSTVNIRINASRERREMDSEQWINQQYSNGNTRDFYAPHDFRGKVDRLSTGLDFFFNDQNELSFEVDYTYDYHQFFNNTFYSNVTNRPDYTYVRNSSHTHKTISYNANYRRKFDAEGHFLELDYHLADNENILPASDFEANVFLFEEEQSNENIIQQLALDYTLPITENTKLETGILWNDRQLESFDYFKPNGLLAENGLFTYHEEIFAAYAQTAFTIGKIDMQAGLRYENFTSNSDNTIDNNTTDLRFSNLFPSAHLSYRLYDSNTFNLGYSKRISRPNFHHINPFQMGNQYFQWEANPSLTPEFSDNIELNFQHTGTPFHWSVSSFYRNRTDVIQWLQDIDSDGVRIISFENIGRKQSYGIEADASYKLASFWNTQLSANYYGTNVDQEIDLTWYRLFSSSIIFKNTFTITKNISADLTYRHTPKNQSEFSFTDPRNRLDLAIRAKFLNNRLTANLRIIDVLDNNLRKNTLITPQVTQHEVWRFQSQTFGVLFNLNYKLFQNQGMTRNRKSRNYDHGGTTD